MRDPEARDTRERRPAFEWVAARAPSAVEITVDDARARRSPSSATSRAVWHASAARVDGRRLNAALRAAGFALGVEERAASVDDVQVGSVSVSGVEIATRRGRDRRRCVDARVGRSGRRRAPGRARARADPRISASPDHDTERVADRPAGVRLLHGAVGRRARRGRRDRRGSRFRSGRDRGRRARSAARDAARHARASRRRRCARCASGSGRRASTTRRSSAATRARARVSSRPDTARTVCCSDRSRARWSPISSRHRPRARPRAVLTRALRLTPQARVSARASGRGRR